MTMIKEDTAVECLEQFTCRYICTLCQPFKPIEATKVGNLETHYLLEHKDQEVTICPYCLSSVQVSAISSHIDSHFKRETKDPYHCPLCPVSKSNLKCLAHHAFEEHQITSIDLFRKCGHCEKLTRDITDLINHLESAKLTLYYCTFPGCLVKSRSVELVKSHVVRCHQADANSVSHSYDYVCSWPLQQQPLVEASTLNFPSPQKALSSSSAISLSCSHCPYITSSMDRFAQHLATCRPGITAGNFLSMTSTLYKCPTCSRASTSMDLIREHLAEVHGQKEYNKLLQQEDLTVPVDENLAKEASMNLLNGTLNGGLGDINSIKKAIFDIVNPGNNVSNSSPLPHQSANQVFKQESMDLNTNSSSEPQQSGELLRTQTTGKSILPTHLSNGQPVEEWVDLFFHETEFLAAFHKAKLTSDLQDFTDARLPEILVKLKHFGTLKVPIMGRANQRRVAACPVCNKNFNHGFSDLKKHLMVGHMEMSREISRFAINFTHSPKFATIQIPNIPKIQSSANKLPTGPNNKTIEAHNPAENYLMKLPKMAPLDGNENSVSPPLPPISSPLECQDVKNHVEATTIEDAEALRPPGRGGIIPLDENGQPLQSAIDAAVSDEEVPTFEIFKPVMGKQRIALAYSMGVLKKLFEDYTYSYSEKLHIINRLNRYSRMYVFMEMHGQGMSCRRYCCAVCTYQSQHSLADVRKHVMGAHCGISPKRFRICLRSSRHDSNHYRLCTDDKMLQYVDLRMSKNQTVPPGFVDGSRLSNCNSNPSSNKTLNEEEDFNEDFNETANSTLQGDTSGIKNDSCLSPTTNGNSSMNGHIAQSTPSSAKDDLNILLAEQAKLTGHLNNPYEGVDFLSHNGTPISLRDGEVGQRIDLPWSENVLLALMNNDRYKGHINTIMKKMNIYANYHLIVVTKERRIHAYICVCGRRFSVVREDEVNDMRPASLADCRRHVLGVHARVTQDMLTLCCQASRISRESNYQLYADKSLLALAEHHKIRTSKGGSLPSMDLSNMSLRSESHENSDTNNNSSSNSSNQNQRHPGTNLPATNLLTLDQGRELVQKYGLPDHWRLERVVNLVYSPEAFNQLLSKQPNLDEDFIQGLHDKMKVYCGFSVYIFRQDTSKQKNQKFYACSACLSASPHGLGDMRKHILGVHAHIPEKIKAAAMAAGRLNRDNFGLYPDDMLISMALMGGRSMNNSFSKNAGLPSMTQVMSTSLTDDLKTLGNQLVTARKREQPEVNVPSSVLHYEADDSNKRPRLTESVWPGQQDEEDLDDDESRSSVDFEKSLEDPQFDDSPMVRDEKRPPIILNLKLPKTNGSTATSGDSSPCPTDDQSATPGSHDPHSRSRRSIMLKSKRPLPTSN